MLMANVLRKLIRESSLLAPDFPSFKRQESAFVILNLFVLSVLLLIHTLFSSYFGTPPHSLIVVLAIGFFLNVVELIWLQSPRSLNATGIVILTWIAIVVNMGIAFTLASLSYRQDTQYFALLVAPILQAAFRFSFGSMLAVMVAGTTLDFFWVWNYFRSHPPSQISEYMEAGTISLIYATTGTLVWMLVSYLRSKQVELERAREQLSTEEKLAAVGRLSSAIAHEIRNPVAMISSALATARNSGLSSEERQEMFEIAANEASRLEKLTTDFLAYARPRSPARQLSDLAESIAYIADVCRPHARERCVTIRADAPDGLCANVDSGQIQQALLNLVMNAIEASPSGAVVALRGKWEDGEIRVEIENANGRIPEEAVGHVFEPFFTTKPSGTGLGLAIARNIARGHGGELSLSRNDDSSVQFRLSVPAYTEGPDRP
jgi:signal transduction histidine kinase